MEPIAAAQNVDRASWVIRGCIGIAVFWCAAIHLEMTSLFRSAAYSQQSSPSLWENLMLRFFAFVLALVLLALAPTALFAQDKIVVSGGYSFLRPPVTAEEILACLALSPCPENIAP